MIWQFGELGYDYSINTCSDGVTISKTAGWWPSPCGGTTGSARPATACTKSCPPWLGLKRDHPVFQTTDFNWDVWGYGKRCT